MNEHSQPQPGARRPLGVLAGATAILADMALIMAGACDVPPAGSEEVAATHALGEESRPAACRDFKVRWECGRVHLSADLDESVGAIAFNEIDREFLVVWDEHDAAVPFDRVMGQRLTTSGDRRAPSFLIVDPSHLLEAPRPHTVPNSLGEPFLAHDSLRNEYLVVWAWQHRPDVVFIDEGYGRRIAAHGGLLGPPFQLSRAAFEPSAAYARDGDEFLYVGRTIGGPDVHAQPVAGGGGPLGDDVIVSAGGESAPAGEVVHNPATGEFLATWRNQGPPAGSRPFTLRARRIAPGGALLGAELEIPTREPGSTIRAAVDPSTGRVLIVYPGFGTRSIHGRLIDAAGTPVGAELDFSSASGVFGRPAVVYVPRLAAYLVAWTSDGDIEAQLVSPRGDRLGRPRRLAGAGGFDLRLAIDPRGSRIAVVWNRDRDLYARVFQPSCVRR